MPPPTLPLRTPSPRPVQQMHSKDYAKQVQESFDKYKQKKRKAALKS